jgi:hypothetical protein
MGTNQVLEDCEIAVKYQRTVVYELEEASKIVQRAAWTARGGCARCGGRGWVVTFDTMDSMSGCYAEYGACPEPLCTEEFRKLTGMDPSYRSKYDERRHTADFSSYISTPEILEARALLKEVVEICNIALAAAKVEKGRTVRVVKGRKVAKGTVGEVIWLGQGGFGQGSYRAGAGRIGLKDSTGTVHWTSESNVEVV